MTEKKHMVIFQTDPQEILRRTAGLCCALLQRYAGICPFPIVVLEALVGAGMNVVVISCEVSCP